jgi:hypothetical protein
MLNDDASLDDPDLNDGHGSETAVAANDESSETEKEANLSVLGPPIVGDPDAVAAEPGTAESYLALEDEPVTVSTSSSSAMTLNVAYEALEQMRRCNLQITCQAQGIGIVDYEQCTACLLSGQAFLPPVATPEGPAVAWGGNNSSNDPTGRSIFQDNFDLVLEENLDNAASDDDDEGSEAGDNPPEPSRVPSTKEMAIVKPSTNDARPVTPELSSTVPEKGELADKQLTENQIELSDNVQDPSLVVTDSAPAATSTAPETKRLFAAPRIGSYFQNVTAVTSKLVQQSQAELSTIQNTIKAPAISLFAGPNDAIPATITAGTTLADTKPPAPRFPRLAKAGAYLFSPPTSFGSTSKDELVQESSENDQPLPRSAKESGGDDKSAKEPRNADSISADCESSDDDDDDDTISTMSTNTTATTSLFGGSTGNGPSFPRLAKANRYLQAKVAETKHQRNQRRHQRRVAAATPCLICATPCCKHHSSKSFRKHGNITLCLDCELVFQADFVLDCLTVPDEVVAQLNDQREGDGLAEEERDRIIMRAQRERLQQRMDRMLDLYDRCRLLLLYSRDFVPSITEQLRNDAKHGNRVSLGSSSAGMVSGILGIAAAATIVTPAGPPLFIASLLFGGSASIVQSTTESRKYHSDHQKLASRIVALQSMTEAILHVTSTLRHAVATMTAQEKAAAAGSVTVAEDETAIALVSSSTTSLASSLSVPITRQSVLAAAGASRFALLSLEETAVTGVAGGSSYMAQTGSNLLKTARLARVAGGAMSAAIFVWEAHNMTKTLQSIQAGDPCTQADRLELLAAQLDGEWPTTEELDRECQTYAQILADRHRLLTEQVVIQLLLEHTQKLKDDSQAVSAAASTDGDAQGESTDGGSVSSRETSLLSRIQAHKSRQNATVVQ